MYIDPNTGGILFQTLSLCAVCAAPLTLIGAGVAALVYFVRKGKKNQQTDPTKDIPS